MKKFYALLSLACFYTLANAQLCPAPIAAFVNACNGTSADLEGPNEFVAFYTTSTLTAGEYTVNYYATDPYTAITNQLAGANAAAPTGGGSITATGCAITFVTSPSTPIPAGSVVIFIPAGYTNNFDVSQYCAYAVTGIYVVTIAPPATAPTWSNNGVLANNPSADRILEVKVASQPSCASRRAYIGTGWTVNADGNFVVWDPTTGSPTYGSGGCAVVTPLKLLSFTATGIGRDANLVWNTSNELNTKEFQVERSEDGKYFSLVKVMPAAGNSTQTLTYKFTDLNIPYGISYYRLKTVDHDGKISFSQVVKVESTLSGLIITNIYPKPTASMLGLNWNAPRAGATALKVFDLAGRVLMAKTLSTAAGMNNYQLNVSSLPKGQYIIRMQKDGETVIDRFTKQ